MEEFMSIFVQQMQKMQVCLAASQRAKSFSSPPPSQAARPVLAGRLETLLSWQKPLEPNK